MAATNGFMSQQLEGASLLVAYTNPNKYDILQIVNQGGEVLASVSYNGTVNLNPTSAGQGSGGTGKYTANVFMDNLYEISPAYPTTTVAQIFAAAFPQNPQQLDILQVRNLGGNISYYLDYLGVAHGS